MKIARTVIAVAALALVAAFGAQAQQKTDKAAGQTTGEMTPQQKADEGVVKKEKATSTVKKEDVKKETASAKKAGQISEGECDPKQKADAGACKKTPEPKSTTTRAEKKAEGAATAKKEAVTVKGEKP